MEIYCTSVHECVTHLFLIYSIEFVFLIFVSNKHWQTRNEFIKLSYIALTVKTKFFQSFFQSFFFKVNIWDAKWLLGLSYTGICNANEILKTFFYQKFILELWLRLDNEVQKLEPFGTLYKITLFVRLESYKTQVSKSNSRRDSNTSIFFTHNS